MGGIGRSEFGIVGRGAAQRRRRGRSLVAASAAVGVMLAGASVAANGTTVAGGNGSGSGPDQLSGPAGVAVDGAGNLYVADTSNERVQRWAPGASSGTTVASGIFRPWNVTFDATGNLYVLRCCSNPAVLRYAPGSTTGVVVAGGNGFGPAANQLWAPFGGLHVDAAGNVYVADAANHRVQKWAPGATSGVTVAGGNGPGSAADQLNRPEGVVLDGAGNIYVADNNNFRVQKWSPGATSGVTVAGGNGDGTAANQVGRSVGIAIDAAGNIYVSEWFNHRVTKWAPGATSGITVAGGNGAGSGANQLSVPWGIAVDSAGNLYVAERGNNRVSKWPPGTPPTILGAADISAAADPGVCVAAIANPVSATGVPTPVVTYNGGAWPTTFPVGTTTVDVVADNGIGSPAVASFDVTVNDTQAPIAIAPPDPDVNATGPAGATVDFTVAASDNCPGVSVASVPASGSTFPIGDTTVTVTATDASGNFSGTSFVVHVAGADEQLADLQQAVVGVGPGQSLVKKVEAISQAFAAGDIAAACDRLQAFGNEVAAHSGKKIDESTAAALLADADRIADVLGCSA